MVMGDKIFRVEDTLVSIGAEILGILKDKDMKVDLLYTQLKNSYPKYIRFERFIYTLDFLYSIGKVELRKDDIVGLL